MFDELNGLIMREMDRSSLPGLAIALVRGQDIVWSRGYGYADLDKKTPVTPSTVFSVQSVTKPVVTTALMQWYDRGRFRLDDPVNEHLAPIRIQNEWEETVPVTIRHLLTHAGGLPVDLGGAAAPQDTGPLTLEDYVSTVVKTVRPPGEEVVYANWGYATTGYLVGRCARQPYDAYLREHVLEPLAMRSTNIGGPSEGMDAATGYFLSALDGEHHSTEPFTWPTQPADPSAALFSTVEDLGHFLIAHLNGGAYEGRRVLSERTVADMHRLHARAGPSQGGMGLGFRVDVAAGRHLICHGGDGVAFTAFIGAYPDEGVGVAVLTNMGRAQTARSVIATAALRTLVGEHQRFELEDLPRRRPGQEWERLAGRYFSTYWDIGATLTVEDGIPAVTMEGAFVAKEEGERSYLSRSEDGMVHGHDGPFDGFDLTFEFGEDGRATRFYGGVYPLRFEWQSDLVPQTVLVVDEEADLVGGWSGIISSPLGPVPIAIDIVDSGAARVTALSAENASVEEFDVERGRLSGYVDLTLPGFGDFRVFLRLNAVAGKLQGRAYARGSFGEVPMDAELRRA